VATVLIVEDDPVLAQVMRRHLIEAGLDVEWAADGERALRKLRFERPDVVVLDLMIPGVDGWTLLDQVRADGDQTPIIVVSARSAEFDKIHVLEHGADDYLVKPASMKELVARVRVALRRAQIAPAASTDDPIDVPGLRLDPRTQRAFVSRDELQQRVWGIPYRPRDRSVDVCVRKIREKIDERSPSHSYIQTHYGIGYRFEPAAATG